MSVSKEHERGWFGHLVTVLLALSAVAIAVSVVHREFVRGEETPAEARGYPSTRHDRWEDWASHGIWTGDTSAGIVLIEFLDFQCVGCRIFHERVLKPVLADSMWEGTDVSFVAMHLPLRIHAHSRPAAIASECAAAQGKFSDFLDAVFASQDAIGVKGWGEFAQEAGVPDLSAFENCVTSEWAHDRVVRAREIADSLGVRSTPTVMINGRAINVPLRPEELIEAIAEARSEAGRSR
jgi:protein-disulfide isomerase